jgi:hypothetical protein
MNKIKITLWMVVVIITTAPAQQLKNSQYSLSIIGGICSSQFTTGDSDFITGITVGIFGDIYFYKNIGFSLEINYTQKGGILRKITPIPSPSNPNPNDYYTIDLYALNKYLEFPIWLKFKQIFNEELSLIPAIGISYSVPLPWQDKSETKNEKIIEYDDIQQFTGQYVDESTDINSLIGLNASLTFSYNKFLIEFRYYSAMDKIDGVLNIKSLDFKFHSIQILLGYSISNF